MKFLGLTTLLITTILTSLTTYSKTVPRTQLSIRQVVDAEQFESLAIPATGVIRQGSTLKFLVDNRVSKNPEIYFINSNYCPTSPVLPAGQPCPTTYKEAAFHYDFAQKSLKNFNYDRQTYNQATYYSTTITDRKFFDARLQELTYTDAKGQDKKIYAAVFIERDLISESLIQHVMQVLKKNVFKDAPLYFVSNATHQKTEKIAGWLKKNGIGVATMEDLLSNVKFVGLNPGTAYGYLRWKPENPDDLEAYEIPVFQELPLELAVVAGVITTSYQDVGSHVNLKSKERGTPNMVLRDEAKLSNLHALDGKPVKLTVTFQGYQIDPSSDAEVMKAYESKIQGPWVRPTYQATTELQTFEAMCGASAPADCLTKASQYGGKVSGLGFLNHPEVMGMGSALQKRLEYRLTPHGFGIPLTFYNDFIAHNVAKNPEFKKALETLVDSEMSQNGRTPLPTAEKKIAIEKLKTLMMTAEIPPQHYQALVVKAKELQASVLQKEGIELTKVKIRSSSNTEDVEGFNGAGLHDSYSAKLKNMDNQDLDCKFEVATDDDTGLTEPEVSPKTLSCAVKGVYASLWNLSAIRERSFRRFDHRYASMGVSVQPTYKYKPDLTIAANSVLITRVVGTETVYGQQLSTQVKNGLVTNPVTGTKAELATITFEASGAHTAINILQYAKPVATEPALTKPVMSQALMQLHSEIGRIVETKYCQAKPSYAPGRKCETIVNSATKPQALDMEFKTFSNGQVLIKQVRTFNAK